MTAVTGTSSSEVALVSQSEENNEELDGSSCCLRRLANKAWGSGWNEELESSERKSLSGVEVESDYKGKEEE